MADNMDVVEESEELQETESVMSLGHVIQGDMQINVLRTHMDFLVDRIDPDFGLLDIMIAHKDLTMAEFHQIRSTLTVEERNQKLLNYIIEKNKVDKLIVALEEARQMHLANYLSSDGERKEIYGDVWPMSEYELGKLISNRPALIDGLDVSYLNDKLYFKNVINKRQHEFILSKPTNLEKNEAMLEILRHGSIEHYKKTIESLRELKQDRILNVLGEENFQSDPVLVGTIKSEASDKRKRPIVGLTALDKELFVVSYQSSDVEVYDSMKLTFSRRWNLKELIDPTDIGSCNRNKCLYIFDYKGSYGEPSEILRVDPNGKLIKKWSPGDDYEAGLSVTGESNVILAVTNKDKLDEYSPDGHLIREINLLAENIRDPWHAIKLTNDNFVVSHGFRKDGPHEVCIVHGDGRLNKSFGGKRGSTIGQIDHPSYLTVYGSGFVMVVDSRNSRVLLLDSDLKFKREVLSKEKQGLKGSLKIHLDESNRRLFVADEEWDNRRILVFDLTQFGEIY